MGKHLYSCYGVKTKASFASSLSAVVGTYVKLGFQPAEPVDIDFGRFEVPTDGGLKYGKAAHSTAGSVWRPLEFTLPFAVDHGLPLHLFFGQDSYSDPTHTLALKDAGFSTPKIFDVLFKPTDGSTYECFNALGCVLGRIRVHVDVQNRYVVAGADITGQGLAVGTYDAGPPENYILSDATGAVGTPHCYGTSTKCLLTWGSTDLLPHMTSIDLVLAKSVVPIQKADSSFINSFHVFDPLMTLVVKLDASSDDDPVIDDFIAKTARTLTFGWGRSATDYVSIAATNATVREVLGGTGRDTEVAFTFASPTFSATVVDAIGDFDAAY